MVSDTAAWRRPKSRSNLCSGFSKIESQGELGLTYSSVLSATSLSIFPHADLLVGSEKWKGYCQTAVYNHIFPRDKFTHLQSPRKVHYRAPKLTATFSPCHCRESGNRFRSAGNAETDLFARRTDIRQRNIDFKEYHWSKRAEIRRQPLEQITSEHQTVPPAARIRTNPKPVLLLW